ncbi:hypothetical protein OTU49_009453 [Cherax quadricarinatus]|uniref:C2H2-type domain-containing protein n=1 Tax=Cherax quadricarinatus TaxID=27406 RepID=A0AAW0WKK9_CHEQU|nr:uncharacterized protein LOC128700175 isoform X2 [Cherax quadricarinatus]
MSSRAHGRGHRGIGARIGYVPRGGGHWTGRGGQRGGRSDYYPSNHGGRSPRPFQRQADPEKLLASLGPDAQLALTTAIINSVLKTSEEKEGRGSFRDNRDLSYRLQRENRREGRGGYYREEMRLRRQYGEPRRYETRWYNEEGRGHQYEREKPSAIPPRYGYGHKNTYPNKRRPSPHGHPGPSFKRQRMERLESEEGENAHHRDAEYMDEGDPEDHERSRDRECHGSVPEDDRGRRDVGRGSKENEGGPSGVQVTIRADGERAVNSDGHVRRVAGRLFVELRCPHCPNQKSITFKEYKLHLVSDHHKSQLNRLARKHSVVLRKIRIQQRQEQKEIEAKWREENGEEFKTAVSRFCSTCKLAFKCLGSNTSEGISYHNRSKLHRMQRHYLHPRCGLCRITFPSRMVYEHHIASINHLRVRTATIDNQGSGRHSDDNNQEEESDDLDLANFMTLDSVGEDDDDVGSEHEEITGGLDAVEAAEKEAATGDDDDDLEPSTIDKKQKGKSKGRGKKGPVDDDDDAQLESDWEKEQPEDEEEGGHKPLGTEYVRRIEAYFCSLCYKIIRADSSLGSRAVQRHCRSLNHLSHYYDHHPAAHQEEDIPSGEEGDGEVDLEEDPDQDKLWEEVDKGLTALQGEIMTEIEGEDATEEQNKDDKVNGTEVEKELEEAEAVAASASSVVAAASGDDQAKDDAKSGKEDAKADRKGEDKSSKLPKDKTVNTSQDSTLDIEAWEEIGDEVGDDFTG